MKQMPQFVIIFLMTLTVIMIWSPQVFAQAPEGQEYVVQADDWLSKIAEKTYGDVLAYRSIVEATNAKVAEDNSFTAISDPNVIEVGQKLWLPTTIEGTASSSSPTAPTAEPGLPHRSDAAARRAGCS